MKTWGRNLFVSSEEVSSPSPIFQKHDQGVPPGPRHLGGVYAGTCKGIACQVALHDGPRSSVSWRAPYAPAPRGLPSRAVGPPVAAAFPQRYPRQARSSARGKFTDSERKVRPGFSVQGFTRFVPLPGRLVPPGGQDEVLEQSEGHGFPEPQDLEARRPYPVDEFLEPEHRSVVVLGPVAEVSSQGVLEGFGGKLLDDEEAPGFRDPGDLGDAVPPVRVVVQLPEDEDRVEGSGLRAPRPGGASLRTAPGPACEGGCVPGFPRRSRDPSQCSSGMFLSPETGAFPPVQ